MLVQLGTFCTVAYYAQPVGGWFYLFSRMCKRHTLETYVLYLEWIVHLGTPLPWREPKQSPWYNFMSFIFIGCTSACPILSMPYLLQPEVWFHDCFPRFNSLLGHLFRHAPSFFSPFCAYNFILVTASSTI